jgi:hypothetical protein
MGFVYYLLEDYEEQRGTWMAAGLFIICWKTTKSRSVDFLFGEAQDAKHKTGASFLRQHGENI